MKKLLIIHTKYRNTGGEDIAVTNEVNYFSKYFNVKVVYFDNSKFQFKNDFLAFLTNTNTLQLFTIHGLKLILVFFKY